MKQSVLVIGLGRFGTAAARELMAIGHDVLAIDRDEARVNEIAPDVTRRCRPTRATRTRSGPSVPPTSPTRSWRSAATPSRASTRRWRCAISAWSTCSRRPGPRCTARSSSGSAQPGWSIRSARWASRSPTRSRRRTSSTTSTSRRSVGIVRVTAPPAWIGRTLGELDLVGRGLTAVALRRGDRITVSPGLWTAESNPVTSSS